MPWGNSRALSTTLEGTRGNLTPLRPSLTFSWKSAPAPKLDGLSREEETRVVVFDGSSCLTFLLPATPVTLARTLVSSSGSSSAGGGGITLIWKVAPALRPVTRVPSSTLWGPLCLNRSPTMVNSTASSSTSSASVLSTVTTSSAVSSRRSIACRVLRRPMGGVIERGVSSPRSSTSGTSTSGFGGTPTLTPRGLSEPLTLTSLAATT